MYEFRQRQQDLQTKMQEHSNADEKFNLTKEVLTGLIIFCFVPPEYGIAWLFSISAVKMSFLSHKRKNLIQNNTEITRGLY